MSAITPTKSKFRRLEEVADGVELEINGQAVLADPDDTVAAVLLVQGVNTFRRNRPSGKFRAPYCMMGVCFECLVTIDGEPEMQSCLVRVREGMQVQIHHAAGRTAQS